MNTFGMPGLDGSLGECLVCGKPFLAEILLGQTVASVTVEGLSHKAFVHKRECLPLLESLHDKPWGEASQVLPEGPLRRALEKACKES